MLKIQIMNCMMKFLLTFGQNNMFLTIAVPLRLEITTIAIGAAKKRINGRRKT